MFETKEEIQELIDSLYGVARKLKRGDILSHAQVREILGCEPHQGSWDHVVNSVRNRLEKNHGIATWFERQVGYKLLTVQEQLTDLPRKRTLKSLRQQRRVRRSVTRLPDKGLSLHDRRAKVFITEQTRQMEKALRRQLRDQKEGAQPSQTNPRRVRPAPAVITEASAE